MPTEGRKNRRLLIGIGTRADPPRGSRSPREVTHLGLHTGTGNHGGGAARIAPEGVPVRNPAFDVTPARLVTAIITEAGVARAPYGESLAALFGSPGRDARDAR